MAQTSRQSRPVTIGDIVEAYNRELHPLVMKLQRILTQIVNSVTVLQQPMGVFDLVEAANTLVAAHANAYITVTNGGACTLEVPAGIFVTGTEIQVAQGGAGQVTIVAGAGVTIRFAETLRLRKQEASGILTCIAPNVFRWSGDVELA